MVAISGSWQAEQRLQQAMDVGGGKQIRAASHQRHALQRIVHCHRQVVTHRHVLARQHHIAERLRCGLDRAPILRPLERAGPRDRDADIEAQRVVCAAGDFVPAFAGRKPPAGAGINRPRFPLRGTAGAGDLDLNLAPRAEAGVQHAHLLKPRQRHLIVVEMLGLPPHFAIPGEAQPGQVFKDRLVIFWAATRAVDILDP